MTSRCVEEDELVRFFDGELTENEADRLRQHVRACAVCAAHSEGLRRTLHELKAPLADVDSDAAIEDVMRLLPTAIADASAARPRPRMARWSLLGGALAAALAMSALIIAPRMLHSRGEDPEAFGARGTPMGTSIARAVGISVSHSSGSGDALAPGAHVRPDDAYAVQYKNLLRDPVYLLAFAVDAAGTVHWLCPAYLDPRSNPAAAALSPSITEASLPSAMQFEAPSSGRMRFIAILSPLPLHVLDVEALRGTELSTASLRARWPTADVRELVTVIVDSSP
ncbi:hypothetical protein BH11MYX4_BH11MYX4_45670 [soil metagenome]